MWTAISLILGLIGAYVLIAAITYVIMRYAMSATREEARGYGIAWGRTLYLAVKRMLSKEN